MRGLFRMPATRRHLLRTARFVILWCMRRAAPALLFLLAAAPVAADPPAGTVVARSAQPTSLLAADGIYWLGDCRLNHRTPDGQLSSTKSPPCGKSADAVAFGLTADASYIYWTQSTCFWRVRRPMGPRERMFCLKNDHEELEKGLAPAGAQRFYIHDDYSSGHDVYQLVRMQNGRTETLVRGRPTPFLSLTTHAGIAYYLDPDGDDLVVALPLAGGRPKVLLRDQCGTPGGLAVDDSGIYFACAALVSVTPAGKPFRNVIVRMPLAGGRPTVLADLEGYAAPLVVDAQHVWWRTWNGLLARVPKSGGKTEVVARATGQAIWNDLVVLDDAAYWLEHEASEIRMAKPPAAPLP